MKILNGAEIASYMKVNQAHTVKALNANGIYPKLVIIRDSESPVISKYVELKKAYGDDIGIEVEDWCREDVAGAIEEANSDTSVHGLIVQLPLNSELSLDEILGKIIPKKDVDGLNNYSSGDIRCFDSATATAINWLLSAYDIPLSNLKIALVGRGRLVGRPLFRMWQDSKYDVTVFHRGDDLTQLVNFDVIVSATGSPHLITNDLVKSGAIIVDAGTASEGGVLVGDVADEVRERADLSAITPKVGGVGPLTVTALFEHVLQAANQTSTNS